MSSFVAWGVVTLFLAAATLVTMGVGQAVWKNQRMASVRYRLFGIGASLLGLVAIAIALRVRELAEADGAVVNLLSLKRGDALTGLMTLVTTMGDVIPSMLIAGVLAVILADRGSWRVAWIPVVLVLVEVAIQILVGKVFGDWTIRDVNPAIVLGGAGYVPSGSVARLSSLFLVTGLLWRRAGHTSGRPWALTGSLLVLVEAFTRLYLGRHLLLDIVGGLALGLALFLVASLVIRVGDITSSPVGRTGP